VKNCAAYDAWRIEVFERDGWQCHRCDSKRTLHVHHIIPFSQLLTQFRKANPQLDLHDQKELAFEAALKFAPLWDASNGETLCIKCHSKEHPNRLGLRKRRR
jgi:5-methylcytosine-specific restriction endonuclease McrA